MFFPHSFNNLQHLYESKCCTKFWPITRCLTLSSTWAISDWGQCKAGSQQLEGVENKFHPVPMKWRHENGFFHCSFQTVQQQILFFIAFMVFNTFLYLQIFPLDIQMIRFLQKQCSIKIYFISLLLALMLIFLTFFSF